MSLELRITSRTDARLLDAMRRHYSAPNGFVGRNICYAILFDGAYYGHTVAGSSPKWLAGRNEFLGTTHADLNRIINNTFFHVERVSGRYPMRNFVSKIVALWEQRAAEDWANKYGDIPLGFDTLVELPRTGECYRRVGWTEVGRTKGFTCKRVAGKGSDSYTGRRVWNVEDLRPKRVFAKKLEVAPLIRKWEPSLLDVMDGIA